MSYSIVTPSPSSLAPMKARMETFCLVLVLTKVHLEKWQLNQRQNLQLNEHACTQYFHYRVTSLKTTGAGQ